MSNHPVKMRAVALHAALVGNHIPAHDEVFDLAEQIGETVGKLHDYIADVRNVDQADAAIEELLNSLIEVNR